MKIFRFLQIKSFIPILVIITVVFLSPMDILNAQTIERSIIGSTGNDLENGQIKIDYSLGEVAVAYNENPSLIISQGFHQGNYLVSSIPSLPSPLINIQLYPNPTFGRIFIQNPSGLFLKYTINDINGATILQGQLANGIELINTFFLNGGLYFITFSDSDHNHQTYKFIKL
jgi:hypothetical protein